MRMVVLGGEVAGRGLWGGHRSGPEWAGLAASVALALAVMFSGIQQILAFFAAAAVLLAGAVLTTPTKFTDYRSVGALLAERWHQRYRRRKGTAVFVPVTARPATRRVKAPKSHTDRADEDGMIEVPIRHRDTAPLMLGSVRSFSVDTPMGPMAVFRHQAGKPYYTATVETIGTSSGLREEHREDAGYVAHGQVLARLARRQQLITHVQSISRSVPVDATDHLLWLRRQIADQVPEVLLESYGELCDVVRSRAEQHRTYETFRIPAGDALYRRAAVHGEGDEGIGLAIFNEVRSAMSYAEMKGSLTGYRPLGPAGMAALLRHLQDPDYDIDDHEGADLADCWQHLDGSTSPNAVVVNGRWHTRTGYVAATAFSPEAVPVEALRPLLRGIQPPVVHTVAVVCELQDARQARGQARRHVADDKARKKTAEEAGRVTDGEEDVLMDASRQRLVDLRVGSGHHGAAFGLYITYSVEDADQVLPVADIIEAAAADAGIDRIEWLDHRQDLASITTMPFTRGIR
ncbi:hypothetical protein [Sinomonas sp. G460-2]|uniref:hypothetical protein n=1 Tax=Sinomonas sp. G460-2 TaxID=3393464 RepID=UPI0039EE66C1